MNALIFFFVGFGFTCVGAVSIIGYLNFIPAGMSVIDFLLFVYKRPEIYLLPIGLIVMALAMYKNPFHS
ncbi:hypothetical protein [Halalkalibacillus halophilus]|uniref:hypothetical protein n=1 Tax=Halalkalibacillus halophilus TaxID=392827 RepID=UPI0004101A56|nr:hypothetical protein [Halalkalibacillus halophilus]